MHTAYAIGPNVNGGPVRYDAFSVGQGQHTTLGAHTPYLAHPGVPHAAYPTIGHQGDVHLAGHAQEQTYRGDFVGPRRRYPNQATGQIVSYQQPQQHHGGQVQIPTGFNPTALYSSHDAQPTRSNGPVVVIPSTHASFYPDHPRYSGGFTFKLFNDERTHFIHLPSQYVLVTEGSTRYLASSKPEQMASRFTLCRHILRDRVCPRGSLCNFIHGVLRAAEGDPAFRRIEVHKNDAMETGMTRYELLPEGASLVVAYPAEERTITIPSQNVYKTRGSDLYLRVLPDGVMHKTPQRCSHYHFKKMCHRGAGCSFIHIAYDTGMLPQAQNALFEHEHATGDILSDACLTASH